MKQILELKKYNVFREIANFIEKHSNKLKIDSIRLKSLPLGFLMRLENKFVIIIEWKGHHYDILVRTTTNYKTFLREVWIENPKTIIAILKYLMEV